MRRLILASAVLAALVAGVRTDAQQSFTTQSAPQGQGRPASELQRPRRIEYGRRDQVEVLHVKGNVYLVAGADTNVTVQVGPLALFVVDTATADMSDKLLAAIRTISPLPIRAIVNTSASPAYVGGNERFATSAGDNVSAFLPQGARVYASEEAYARMSNPRDGSTPLPTGMWPTDAFAGPLKSLYNGEPIELIHLPAAHTSGDLMVFFRTSDVLSTGEIFSSDRYPVIDAKNGGTLNGILDALNRAIDIAIPEYNSMGGTRVIPGHGRIGNEIDLVEYRDGLTIIADRITQRILEGRTLQQIQAEGVSLDYDGLYGATSGSWTTSMFIEAAHNEIKATIGPWRARLLRNVPADELPFLSTSTTGRPGTARAPARAAAARTNVDPLDGKWVMDVFTSKYEPINLQPYRREMTLTFNGAEFTHQTQTWRRIGNASPLSTTNYTARLDGQEHAIPFTSSTVRFRRIDANTIERTLSGSDGTETATWTLSADRRTLTVEAKGVDPQKVAYTSTQIFKKQ
jgi:glyoxylase-like metal-dependent hydrolase (beta-lactamase superfamily II)